MRVETNLMTVTTTSQTIPIHLSKVVISNYTNNSTALPEDPPDMAARPPPPSVNFATCAFTLARRAQALVVEEAELPLLVGVPLVAEPLTADALAAPAETAEAGALDEAAEVGLMEVGFLRVLSRLMVWCFRKTEGLL